VAWSSPSLMLERGTEGVSYENPKYLQYFSGIIIHICIISCLAKGITGFHNIKTDKVKKKALQNSNPLESVIPYVNASVSLPFASIPSLR